MPRPLPDLAFLYECFTLDTETGVLTWNVRPRSHFRSNGTWRHFNTNYSGRLAGYIRSDRYLRVKIGYGLAVPYPYQTHRIVWKMVHGRDPIPTVDHINRDPGDNRPSNLREATYAVQAENRKCVDADRLGVYPTRSGKFRAQIIRTKRIFYLGTFASASEARAAVLAACQEHSP